MDTLASSFWCWGIFLIIWLRSRIPWWQEEQEEQEDQEEEEEQW